MHKYYGDRNIMSLVDPEGGSGGWNPPFRWEFLKSRENCRINIDFFMLEPHLFKLSGSTPVCVSSRVQLVIFLLGSILPVSHKGIFPSNFRYPPSRACEMHTSECVCSNQY